MGIYMNEIADYVAQYLSDRYFKDHLTGNILLEKYEWYKIVWQRFHADAFYGRNNTYFKWDDVPKPYYEDMVIRIVSDQLLERYEFRSGKWIDIGSLHPEIYK